ncbi:hypothetical protein SKAU_G00018630 [Synaphobranchus kaupii]|uniref:Uncharacterized protein n=1 Tax=Synaphobranchus kaupii TaxID=118154 RepID=A0A9Q1GCN2_SYNKA|nr:hypothetical protein SKAU_G00018630 [Synaphobranchus kaupii]
MNWLKGLKWRMVGRTLRWQQIGKRGAPAVLSFGVWNRDFRHFRLLPRACAERHAPVKGNTWLVELKDTEWDFPKEISKDATLEATAEDGPSAEVLRAIRSMQNDFSKKFEDVLAGICEIKGDLQSQANRITEAEERIGRAEDNLDSMHNAIKVLQEKCATLEMKTEDQENGASQQSTAHRPPRKAETHRQQRLFDPVKRQLQSMGLPYRMFYPAILVITRNGQRHSFKTVPEAERFVRTIQQDSGSAPVPNDE